MPTKEAKILATDLNSYYTRLNQIRSKFGLAQVTYSTVTSDTKATSQQAKTLKSEVDTVKSSTKYLNSVVTWEPGTSIDQGQPITTLPFVTLDTTLDNMMTACAHDSVNSTHGNFSDFSYRKSIFNYSIFFRNFVFKFYNNLFRIQKAI